MTLKPPPPPLSPHPLACHSPGTTPRPAQALPSTWNSHPEPPAQTPLTSSGLRKLPRHRLPHSLQLPSTCVWEGAPVLPTRDAARGHLPQPRGRPYILPGTARWPEQVRPRMPSPGQTGPEPALGASKERAGSTVTAQQSPGPGVWEQRPPPSLSNQSSKEGAARREEVRDAEEEEGTQLELLNHTTSLDLNRSPEQSGPSEGLRAVGGGSGADLRGSGTA